MHVHHAAILVLFSTPALAQIDPAWADSPDGDARVLRLDLSEHGMAGPTHPGLGSGAPGAGCGGFEQGFLFTGQLPEGDTPIDCQFTPDGSTIVMVFRDSRNLIAKDASSAAVVAEVDLSGSPQAVAVTPDGSTAVTANIWEDTASIVDLVNQQELAVVPIGDQPGVVRITPDGTKAIIGNTVDQSLSVIDIATATELHRIPGAGFTGITALTSESGAVHSRFTQFECVDDATVIHPDNVNEEIDFFDIAAGTVSSVPSTIDPRGIAITPDRSTAVVSHFLGAQTVSVVDTATQTITKTIAVGMDTWEHIAVNHDATKAVVAVQNAVVVVDLVAATVSPALSTASVNALYTTADGLHVLGVGYRGALISFASETVVNELNNIVSTWIGAVSPASQRGVMIAIHNGEDMLVVNTNGAAGFLEYVEPSGPKPEADKTRKVAISPDGTRAVTTNVLSDNASVMNLETGALEMIVGLGDRPAEVEITPDGSQAVIANLDSTFVSVIDLGSLTVTDIPTSTRNSEVEISPDGQYAYVAVVVSDGVWRIDLQTLAVAGPKLATGDMGGVSYGFNQASGMTLSHDGATLVTCDSYSDSVTLIDTGTWSVVATVGVGDLPARAVFSDDDATIYVSNRTSGTVSVVSNAGGSSTLLQTIGVGTWPFEMVLSKDQAKLYVANFLDDELGVVDLGSGMQTGTIPLYDAPQGLHLNAAGTCLSVASGGWSVSVGPGPKTQINTFGAFSVVDTATDTVVEEIVTDLPPAALVFDATGTLGLVPSPFGDGLTTMGIGIGDGYCVAEPSSLGSPASIAASGSAVVADNAFRLTAGNMPPGEFGYFLVGMGNTEIFPVNGSQGRLCVAGSKIGRFVSLVQSSGVDGTFSIDVDLTLVPMAPPVAIQPGETWNFQAWFRDKNPGNTSNFTDGVSVGFL